MEEEKNIGIEPTEINVSNEPNNQESVQNNVELKKVDNLYQANNGDDNNNQNDNVKSNKIVLILLILLLIALGIIGYLILSAKDDKGSNQILEAPSITIVGKSEVTLTVGEDYVEPGYSASDSKDGDITGKVIITGSVDTTKAGFYTIMYSVTDSDNITTNITRKITVISKTTTLSITLKGEDVVTIPQGTTYTEAGYTATDSKDGDLTKKVVVTGKVDTKKIGSYTLTYTVTNSASEITSVTRTIIVIENMKELSLKSDIVKKLTTYISGYNLDNNNYQSKKITYKDISKENMLIIAYNSIIVNEYKAILGEDYIEYEKLEISDARLKKELAKIYHTDDIVIPLTTEVLPDCDYLYCDGNSISVSYDKYASAWVPGGHKDVSLPINVTITSANQYGDYIYLYDNGIHYKKTIEGYEMTLGETIEDNDDYCSKDSIIGYIYTDTDYVNKVGEIKCKNGSTFGTDTITDNYYTKAVVRYKHTFQKNSDGEYYFVSSEPIK